MASSRRETDNPASRASRARADVTSISDSRLTATGPALSQRATADVPRSRT
jgi:hypothetical protein